jgi:hypothetical protein
VEVRYPHHKKLFIFFKRISIIVAGELYIPSLKEEESSPEEDFCHQWKDSIITVRSSLSSAEEARIIDGRSS